MSFWLEISLVVFGVALGTGIGLQLSKRLCWYLPSVSNAELSRHLTESLAMAEALKEVWVGRVSTFSDSHEQVLGYLRKLEIARDAIESSLKQYAMGLFHNLPDDLVERISRDVAQTVVRSVEQDIHQRLHTLGSEYVLLRDVSDCSINVSLTAGFSDWQTLQAALRKVEKFRPKTQSNGDNVTNFDAQRQFNVYLNELGEALFHLKWSGQLSFQVKDSEIAL